MDINSLIIVSSVLVTVLVVCFWFLFFRKTYELEDQGIIVKYPNKREKIRWDEILSMSNMPRYGGYYLEIKTKDKTYGIYYYQRLWFFLFNYKIKSAEGVMKNPSGNQIDFF